MAKIDFGGTIEEVITSERSLSWVTAFKGPARPLI